MNKPIYKIVGCDINTLKVGSRVHILLENGMWIKTSPAIKVLGHPNGKFWIETKNSIYQNYSNC